MKIVVAVDRNWGFARNGKIPWRDSVDLKFFKSITNGGCCIMGRHTYSDILTYGTLKNDQILPGRQSIVLSSNPNTQTPGALVASSIEDAVLFCDKAPKFLIGGLQVFKEGLQKGYVTEMYISKRHKDYNCDLFFPTEFLPNFYIADVIEMTSEFDVIHYIKGEAPRVRTD